MTASLAVAALIIHTAAAPPPGAEVVTFFSIANRTGAGVRVRVWADGRELFARALPATAAPQSGVMPPPPPYPVLELKIMLPRATRRLVVEKTLALKTTRTFTIAGFDRRDAGFRITLTRTGIQVSQDYRPIR